MTLAGLRPGEKLFEEKLMAEEGLKKTKNKLIHMSLMQSRMVRILTEMQVRHTLKDCRNTW